MRSRGLGENIEGFLGQFNSRMWNSKQIGIAQVRNILPFYD
jgi:hypothetical protein